MIFAMLVIRQAQMDIFRDRFLQDFEDQCVRNLVERFPRRCAALGETGLRRLIRSSIKRSAEFDIRSESDVATFIDLSIKLGEDFDHREELAFEVEPLRDRSLPGDARLSLTMARLELKPGFRE
jgi:hypothetical protein